MNDEETGPLILGDCCISLSHSTTYEPPLYLLPELLPKVKPNARDVEVWDGVADAIDTDNSYWRVASPLGLKRASKNSGASELVTESSTNSLAYMIASNKLASAGLSPEILSKGNFCAESIMNEIENYCKIAGFSEEEKSLVMSNHFINILAWAKLREINYPVCRRHGFKKDDSTSVRKRSRDEHNSDLEPSPTPWSMDVDNPAMTGRFISGKEVNVEEKVDLLETLAQLYQKPILSLCSRGSQTDHVVPPGVINTTSPYNEIPTLVQFDPMSELKWSSGIQESPLFQIQLISSGVARHRTDLKLAHTNFGRQEGVTAFKNGYSRVHIGLGAYTTFPDFVSPHHFSLICRGPTDKADLWLLNYGRNGVKVEKQKWVLGEPVKLTIPAVLRITNDLRIEVRYKHDETIDNSVIVKCEVE